MTDQKILQLHVEEKRFYCQHGDAFKRNYFSVSIFSNLFIRVKVIIYLWREGLFLSFLGDCIGGGGAASI